MGNDAFSHIGSRSTTLMGSLPTLVNGLYFLSSRSERSDWLEKKHVTGPLWFSWPMARSKFRKRIIILIANKIENKITNIIANKTENN